MFVSSAQGQFFDFYWEGTSSDWSMNGSWDQPGWPAATTDRAFVGSYNGSPVPWAYLSRDIEIGELVVQPGGRVYTAGKYGAHQLVVRGLTEIQRGIVEVFPEGATGNSDFDTDDLHILDLGSLRIRDGAVVEVDEQLLIDETSEIRGDGELRLYGAEVAINNGSIAPGFVGASSTGLFWLRPSSGQTAAIDLDGTTGDGSLGVFYDLFIIDVDLSDSILNGDISIAVDGELQMNRPWTYAGSSENRISACCDSAEIGGNGEPSVISGERFTLIGELLVGRASLLRLDAETVFGAAADVDVTGEGTGYRAELVINAPPTFFAGSRIAVSEDSAVEFRAPASIPSQTIQPVDGRLVFNADVTIGGESGTFNWDGNGTTSTEVAGATLTIDVDQIDPDDVFDGDIDLVFATLDVEVAGAEWGLDGEMGLSGGSAVFGDSLRVDGAIASTQGTNRVSSASLHLEPGGAVSATGGLLRLTSPMLAFNGAGFSGGGTVACEGTQKNVNAPTTASMPSGTFSMNGSAAANHWQIDDVLDITARRVARFGSDPVTDDISISAPGRLKVNLTSEPSYRVAGMLSLVGNDPGDPPARLLEGGTPIVVSGGAVASGEIGLDAAVRLTSALEIDRFTTLRLNGGDSPEPNVIATSSAVTFVSDATSLLSISAHTIIEAGATIGPGRVRVSGFTELEGDLGVPGTDVEVIDGPLVPGSGTSTREAVVDALVVTETGQSNFLLNGTGPGEHDRFLLTRGDDSSFRGSLVVSPIAGYTPQHCDEFELIRATSGTPVYAFDRVISPFGISTEASGGSFFIRVRACEADVVCDGILDLADIVAFSQAFLSMDMLGDFNGDGLFDLADITAFVTAFVVGCPPGP